MVPAGGRGSTRGVMNGVEERDGSGARFAVVTWNRLKKGCCGFDFSAVDEPEGPGDVEVVAVGACWPTLARAVGPL